MNTTQKQLWKKLQAFQLDIPEADFSFSDRLARDNGWTKEYTLAVVEEYKKFLFLMATSPHPITPSDQVDQAWHLHMIYTYSYWIELCRNTIGKDLHHGPTKGGNTEKDKFEDWYARTLELYKTTFGQVPPSNIWPASKIRFGEINYRRVNLHNNWVFPKPDWGWLSTSFCLLLLAIAFRACLKIKFRSSVHSV